MTMHKATTDHPGVRTALEIRDSEEGGEPLVWTRHEQKGLFELFCTQAGEFFARYSDGDMKTSWPIDATKANEIIANNNKEREAQLPNALLRNGYVEARDHITYNTKIDEILFVGEGDSEKAAAMYRTRDGHIYLHIIECKSDYIWPLTDENMRDDMI